MTKHSNPAFIRWIKFNLVGAAGMALQLGALAIFNRIAASHYLIASTARSSCPTVVQAMMDSSEPPISGKIHAAGPALCKAVCARRKGRRQQHQDDCGRHDLRS